MMQRSWLPLRVGARRTSHERSGSMASHSRMEQEGQRFVLEGRTSHRDSRRMCSLDLDRNPVHQMSEMLEQRFR